MRTLLTTLGASATSLLISAQSFAQQNCCTPPTSVPEPSTIALLAVGGVALVLSRRYPRAGRIVSAVALVAATVLWSQTGMAVTDCCIR